MEVLARSEASASGGGVMQILLISTNGRFEPQFGRDWEISCRA